METYYKPEDQPEFEEIGKGAPRIRQKKFLTTTVRCFPLWIEGREPVWEK